MATKKEILRRSWYVLVKEHHCFVEEQSDQRQTHLEKHNYHRCLVRHDILKKDKKKLMKISTASEGVYDNNNG